MAYAPKRAGRVIQQIKGNRIFDPYVQGRIAYAPKRTGFLIQWITCIQKMDGKQIHSFPDGAVCGAYAIRPYTDTQKMGRYRYVILMGNPILFGKRIQRIRIEQIRIGRMNHLLMVMGICGAYAIRPYTGTSKMGRYGQVVLMGNPIFGGYKIQLEMVNLILFGKRIQSIRI